MTSLTAHPPFLPDIAPIVIDLPYPPSVNRIWRAVGKNVVLSAAYIRWKIAADGLFLTQKSVLQGRCFSGGFEALIVLDKAAARGDIDNRAKACLDAAQRFGLVEDDKDCQRLIIEYGVAPSGCRLTLSPCEVR